jgi:hypothetical protein
VDALMHVSEMGIDFVHQQLEEGLARRNQPLTLDALRQANNVSVMLCYQAADLYAYLGNLEPADLEDKAVNPELSRTTATYPQGTE